MTNLTSKIRKNRTTTALSIMTMSVPVLYLIGYFYEYGYLSGFGISTEFFPRSIQEYLVNAFLAFIQLVIAIFTLAKNNINKLFVFFGIITSIALIIVFIEKQKIFFEKILGKFKKYKHIDVILFPAAAGFFGILFIYSILFILGVIVLITYMSYAQGVSDAEKSIYKYKQDLKENNDNSIHIYKNDSLITKGIFIAKSNQYVAIFDGAKTTIYPLKEEIIITHPPPETKKPSNQEK